MKNTDQHPKKPGRGRRSGSAISREHIIQTAIDEFGKHGYAETTIRKIGAAAGIDAKLVHYHFGTKENLFAACIAEIFHSRGLPEILLSATDSPGTAYLENVFQLLEDSNLGPIYIGLIRSIGSHEESRRVFERFLHQAIFKDIAPHFETSYPDLRLLLMGSQILGLIMVRYVLQFGPLAEIPRTELAKIAGPTLDRYLTGVLDIDR